MRRSTQTLASLLESAGSQGRLVDVGFFTVSYEQALTKVREFSLEDPAHWVLPVVQAAVSGKAESVWFTETGKVHQCLIRGLEPGLLAKISPKLISLEPTGRAEGDYLRRSVWALTTLGAFAVAQGDLLVEWNGKELLLRDFEGDPDILVIAVSCAENAPGSWISMLGKRAARTAAHLESLKQYARFAPIELYLDGVSLSDMTRARSTNEMPIVTLAEGWANAGSMWDPEPSGSFLNAFIEGRPLLSGGDAKDSIFLCFTVALQLSRAKRVRRSRTGKKMTQQYCRYEAVLQKPAIYWVKDGIIVETRFFAERPIGGVMVVHDPTLPTDLSGLKLREFDADAFTWIDAFNKNGGRVAMELRSRSSSLKEMDTFLFNRIAGESLSTLDKVKNSLFDAFMVGTAAPLAGEEAESGPMEALADSLKHFTTLIVSPAP